MLVEIISDPIVEIDRRFDEADEINAYNQSVDQYCRDNGITYLRYEKQCYWAERGVGEYPEPEYEAYNIEHNQDRDKEIEYDNDR